MNVGQPKTQGWFKYAFSSFTFAPHLLLVGEPSLACDTLLSRIRNPSQNRLVPSPPPSSFRISWQATQFPPLSICPDGYEAPQASTHPRSFSQALPPREPNRILIPILISRLSLRNEYRSAIVLLVLAPQNDLFSKRWGGVTCSFRIEMLLTNYSEMGRASGRRMSLWWILLARVSVPCRLVWSQRLDSESGRHASVMPLSGGIATALSSPSRIFRIGWAVSKSTA